MIHVDIMDGSFVDNFGMGYQDMAFIKKNTTKQVEAHLMVRKPYNYLDILFNLGGVLIHELYFSILGSGELSSSLSDKINEDFGDFNSFQEEFIRQANLLVGSGYTFLVLNNNNQLEIINVPNQDTPYSYGLIPLMNIDLWEHAYYLDYQNRKDEYINNFFSIVNFSEVSNNYEKAKTIQKNL